MKLIFLPKVFCKFLNFPCTFTIAKVKIGYKIWVGTYSNRINKLGKMIWSQFLIKILGIHVGNSILNNNDWDKINDYIQKRIIVGKETE